METVENRTTHQPQQPSSVQSDSATAETSGQSMSSAEGAACGQDRTGSDIYRST